MKSRREYLSALSVGGVLTMAGCATLDSGGNAAPDIPPEAYPPGTGDEGIVDDAVAFETHLTALQDRSYTYSHRYDPGDGATERLISGRQENGAEGPRLVREQYDTSFSRENPAFQLSRKRDIRAWHGAEMPPEQEYRKITVTTEVSDPEYYNNTYADSEEYPPGTHVTYEQYGFNSLVQNQKGLLPGTLLRPIDYVPESFDSKEEVIQFVADGFSEDATRTDGFSVSGHVKISTGGIIREISIVFEENRSENRGVAEAEVTGLASTTVRETPEWVDSEF